MSKSGRGRFFEDFRFGETIAHATPRTLSEADGALYIALTGSRFPLHCAEPFARALGLPRAPLDDVLVFHVVFGKSVPDISLNAIANLGYAEMIFGAPVCPGDTLRVRSEVIGLKEASNRKTGIVYVRTRGENQRGETVLSFARWVLVPKRDETAPAPAPIVPALSKALGSNDLRPIGGLDVSGYDTAAAGSPDLWDDFAPGERVDHVDGVTIEEAEHMMATRLYQNTARVHLNQHVEKDGRFGRRLVYGGHVISLARALSFNGLANAFRIAAVNGGRHANPCFAGDTVYAWSEVLAKAELGPEPRMGALRLRTIATKDRACTDFPRLGPDQNLDPAVLLELDYWVLMPRRA